MLKISAQSEYAMIVLRYLLKFDEFKKISEVATGTNVKEPILRKITNKLERSWIIASNKWRSWGIKILKKDIYVYEILEIMWEDLHVAVCSGKACNKSQICEISPIISNLQRWLDAVLKITKI